jgi:hypothetical protein
MNKSPKEFAAITTFYRSERSAYSVYWYAEQGLWEVWDRTEPKLMGVYHKSTIDKAGKQWPEILPKLISIWEGKGIYKAGGPGREIPAWRTRKKDPIIEIPSGQIGLNFN